MRTARPLMNPLAGLALLAALFVACTPPRPPPPVCDEQLTLTCSGADLVEIDPCNDNAETVRSTCPTACYLGACVNCVPDSGLACAGDDLVVTDSCGVVESVVQSCPNGCADAACISPDCLVEGEVTCLGNLIMDVDSCGNLRDFVQRCPASNPCNNGVCEGCFLPESIACFENDLFEYDACGGEVGLAGVCEVETEICSGIDNQCIPGDPTTCVPNAGVVCHEGNLHFRDSCLRVQPDIQRECAFGCDDETGCLNDCPVQEIGQVCLDGNVHVLERACPDDPATPGALRESCETGCRAGLCAGECLPDVGVVCDGVDLRAVDSCGVVGEVFNSCEFECEDGRCQ